MSTENTVREAQSQQDYNPSAKQKAGAKLSRIPVKVVQGEVLKKPDWIRVKAGSPSTRFYEIKDILREMVAELKDEIGDFQCRVFTDSAPILERSWARKSGIGWVGKNANLITKQTGSFYFLAEIICDLELVEDYETTDHCGSCRKCIDACPTDAIVADRVIDGSKCISYATIELKNEIPAHFKGKMEDWMFGCDICQDVCPWNRFSKPHQQQKFKPNSMLQNLEKSDWQELSQELFSEIFRKSPVKRTKFAGLKRNIEFLTDSKTSDF